MTKKKGSKKSKKTKGHGSKKNKGPGLATEVGGLVTVGKIATHGGAIQWLIKHPTMEGAKEAYTAAKAGAMLPTNYIPLAGGAVIHMVKNKPIVKIVLKPLDQLAKKYLGRGL